VVAGHHEDFFLKIGRKNKLSDLGNEVQILTHLAESGLPIAHVLASGEQSRPYLALRTVRGQSMTRFVSPDANDYNSDRALLYFRKFGESLGKIHSMDIPWQRVKERRFHHFLSEEIMEDNRFRSADQWLRANEPADRKQIFVHGDHHYANLLWEKDRVSAVLDWEICGQGWREFDIAWAIIVRPRQSFLKTERERNAVLEGYLKHGSFDDTSVRWCEILNTLHFASNFRKLPEPSYTSFALKRIERMIKDF
jgi:aminoglycoside phosphotransferase (APT) family kinase protein